ncbi:hypothetical protein HK405_014312, partial [Cladochytrium tenue]
GRKSIFRAIYFGYDGAKRNYEDQIRTIVETGLKNVGPRPVVFGECGIPMDIDQKKAFETGDYTLHTKFLDACISAMEANLVNFTLWNYNPGNDNIFGDHWNGEDFSIYSPKPSPSVSPIASRSSLRRDRYSPPPRSQQPTPTSPAAGGNGGADSDSISELSDGSDVVVLSPSRSRKPRSKLAVDITASLLSSPTTTPAAALPSAATSDPGSPRHLRTSLAAPTSPFDITDAFFHDPRDADEENDVTSPDRLEGHPDHAHHEGGRALDAIVRPYAAKIAGAPVSARFDLASLEYELAFETPAPAPGEAVVSLVDTSVAAGPVDDALVTEIFVPNFHYRRPVLPTKGEDTAAPVSALEVQVSDGEWCYVQERQSLYWVRDPAYTGGGGDAPVRHTIRVRCAAAPALPRAARGQLQSGGALTVAVAAAAAVAAVAAWWAAAGGGAA